MIDLVYEDVTKIEVSLLGKIFKCKRVACTLLELEYQLIYGP